MYIIKKRYSIVGNPKLDQKSKNKKFFFAFFKSDQLLVSIVMANSPQVGISSICATPSLFTKSVIPGLCEKMAILL